MGIQQEDKPSASRFLDLAQELKLGIGKLEQIETEELLLG
jgi:hypothetical protein